MVELKFNSRNYPVTGGCTLVEVPGPVVEEFDLKRFCGHAWRGPGGRKKFSGPPMSVPETGTDIGGPARRWRQGVSNFLRNMTDGLIDRSALRYVLYGLLLPAH